MAGGGPQGNPEGSRRRGSPGRGGEREEETGRGGVTATPCRERARLRPSRGARGPPARGPRPPRNPRRAAPPRHARAFISGNTALKIHAQPAPRRVPSPVPIEDLVVPISLNVS